MKIEWTNTFSTDFDIEQAKIDFEDLMICKPNKDPDRVIYDAVNANFIADGEEYIDIQPGIELAAKALRKAIGGIQLRMEGV